MSAEGYQVVSQAPLHFLPHISPDWIAVALNLSPYALFMNYDAPSGGLVCPVGAYFKQGSSRIRPLRLYLPSGSALICQLKNTVQFFAFLFILPEDM